MKTLTVLNLVEKHRSRPPSKRNPAKIFTKTLTMAATLPPELLFMFTSIRDHKLLTILFTTRTHFSVNILIGQ